MKEPVAGYQPLDDLLRRLKITVKDTAPLLAAVTHQSFFGEVADEGETNEALGFLGLRVISLVVVARLRKLYPKAKRAELAAIHDQLVRQSTLEQAAIGVNLEQALRLGKGMWTSFRTHPTTRTTVLADAFRAIMGAIFEDLGYKVTANLVDRLIMTQLENVLSSANNPKTDLQNYLQGTLQLKCFPVYRVRKVEDDGHGGKRFHVSVQVSGVEIANGEGSNQRRAEVHAASQALTLKDIWSVNIQPSTPT